MIKKELNDTTVQKFRVGKVYVFVIDFILFFYHFCQMLVKVLYM